MKIKKQKAKGIITRKPRELSIEHREKEYALVEDAMSLLTVREIEGKIINALAYSFEDSKGRRMNGLTYWGMVALVETRKNNRWKPVFGEPLIEFNGAENAIMKVSCKNPKTKQIEWGIASFNPKDRFSERKAYTICKRNALEKFIPLGEKFAFTEKILKYNPDNVAKITTGEKKQKPILTIQEDKKSFAIPVSEIADNEDTNRYLKVYFTRIWEMKIDTDKVHSYHKKLYKVDSLKKLPIVEIMKLNRILDAAQKNPAEKEKLIQQIGG